MKGRMDPRSCFIVQNLISFHLIARKVVFELLSNLSLPTIAKRPSAKNSDSAFMVAGPERARLPSGGLLATLETVICGSCPD